MVHACEQLIFINWINNIIPFNKMLSTIQKSKINRPWNSPPPQFFVDRRTNRVWSNSRVSTIYCYKRGRKCTIDFLRVRRPWARPWHWNPSAALIYTGRWTLGWLTRLLHRLEQLHNTPAAYIHTIHTCYVHRYNYIYVYMYT